MIEIIQNVLPYTVVASHFLLAFLFLAVIFRKSWGRAVFAFVGRNILGIGFLVAASAIGGSLFYSELVGYEPCPLCWWQRLFLYPQILLFGVALWKRDRGVFAYSTALAAFAGIIALYHTYVYLGGTSILPCTALGGACAKNYVMEFGYITIPTMSLTIVLFLLLLAWINRIYLKNENRNA